MRPFLRAYLSIAVFSTSAIAGSVVDTVGENIEIHHPSGDVFVFNKEEFMKYRNPSPQTTSPIIMAELVFAGLSQPTEMESAGDDRLFVTELKSGKVIVIQPDNSFSTFLNISSRLDTSGESGLYSITFHPNYSTNGYFYLYYTEVSTLNLIIERFQVSVDSNLASMATGEILLRWNLFLDHGHVGGKVQFHPDGTMWILFGEGRRRNDVISPNSYVGKILRIDPDIPDTASGLLYSIPPGNPYIGNPNVLDEIMGSGSRNPWRWCFDADSGGNIKIYTGDVGQNLIEELNVFSDSAFYESAPDSSIWALHLGWPFMEGLRCFPDPFNCDTAGMGLTLPVYDYFHADTGEFTGRSITAGYVYRGSIPELFGKFVFGDFVSGKVWTYHVDGPDTIITDHTASLGFPQQPFIVSFGRDRTGELYIVDYVGGKLYKIVQWVPSITDCNNNFVEDSLDILSGFSSDSNNNGIPDECENCCNLAGDANYSGDINISDASFIVKYIFLGDSELTCCDQVDANGSGDLNIGDATHIVKYIFQGGDPPSCPIPGLLPCP